MGRFCAALSLVPAVLARQCGGVPGTRKKRPRERQGGNRQSTASRLLEGLDRLHSLSRCTARRQTAQQGSRKPALTSPFPAKTTRRSLRPFPPVPSRATPHTNSESLVTPSEDSRPFDPIRRRGQGGGRSRRVESRRRLGVRKGGLVGRGEKKGRQVRARRGGGAGSRAGGWIVMSRFGEKEREAGRGDVA